MGWTCGWGREKRNACRILIWEAFERGPHGRPKRIWEEDTKTPPCGGRE
jgi:hypothetical protein